MNILACDPGPERTGWCELHDGVIGPHGWDANDEVLLVLRNGMTELFVIESPQAQDRPLGPALRNTIWWTGRYIEALDSRGETWREVEEREIACWLTGSSSPDNSAIKQELKNIFGDKRQVVCTACEGTGQIPGKRGQRSCPTCAGKKFKTVPGPLNGMNEHELSALAVAFVVQKQADIEAQRSEFKRVLTTNPESE